jgi:hypothetical protein
MSSAGVSTTTGGLAQFANSFAISPIILVGGAANNTSGGKLPISQLLQPGNWPSGPLSPSAGIDLDNFFALFTVMPGDTLIENINAKWPLANQQVAANAIISQPLHLSLRMTCPGREESGVTYAGKQAVMTALQSTLQQHTDLGGWYDVATPSYLYQGCLLLSLRDITDASQGGQVQVEYIWEFEQPLISTAAAQGAQNVFMSKLTNQTINTGGALGSNPAAASVGNPSSPITPSVVPGAQGLSGVSAGSAFLAPVPTGSPVPPLNAVSPITPGS